MSLVPWAALVLAIPVYAVAQPKDLGQGASTPNSVEEQIRRILAAKSIDDGEDGVTASYRALFKAVGRDGLGDLQAHPHDGIAVRAAWERVRLTIPATDSSRSTAVDAAELAWFVGFLEGRARVRIPAWWADAVRGRMARITFRRPCLGFPVRTIRPD